MVSAKQQLANQTNARKSTGPRTSAGKARAARNALRHGLCTLAPILPGEDPAQWQAFRQRVRRDLHAKGSLQGALAERVALCQWRLRRLTDHETALVRAQITIMQQSPGISGFAYTTLRTELNKVQQEQHSLLCLRRELPDVLAATQRLQKEPDESPVSGQEAYAFAENLFSHHLFTARDGHAHSKAFLRAIGKQVRAGHDAYESQAWTVSCLRKALAWAACRRRLPPEQLLTEVLDRLQQQIARIPRQRRELRLREAHLREHLEQEELAFSARYATLPAELQESLQRHEVHLSRQLRQALEQLELLQARPRAKPVVAAEE